MDLFYLKEHHARTLLIEFRWNVDKLLAVFVEKGTDQLYKEVGLVIGGSDGESSRDPLSLVLCEICMENEPVLETTTMDCGHCFCNNCWTEHFIVKINEGESRRISCMSYKCCTVCDEAKVRQLVSARRPDLAEKFDSFLFQSYIDDNDRVKWCPSAPHCGNAICVEEDQYCEVECACGQQFCFNCLSETHSPCSCFIWGLWLKKCSDESETVNWMNVNTKLCPSCQKSVEKNGGCNLVRCICRQYFCWKCGGATGSQHTWDSIAGHSCGQYTENQVKNLEMSKTQLKRYIHYFNHHKAQKNSLMAESLLKEKLIERVKNLEEREGWASENYKWVFVGLSRLFKSRKVLCYTYPLAFYMFGEDELIEKQITPKEKKIKHNLFEDLQQQLEEKVEKLSMGLEQPFDDLTHPFDETRLGIIALSSVTDELCKSIYKFVENELLGILPQNHAIAPYISNGIVKASELS
ncbi:probable E3 ubiquitin-protein ligase ARI1 [Impatiens glandulifera]|uniref:probable E3 ubiquitin-protein ligase ARI1 n=1 Tax=Impatiens glandulifera TaxID=253017 RepID=UPI001FB084E5|nr:probable E3 ubiquitin-protein ligase ARI1 [Impatiens glandulifera]